MKKIYKALTFDQVKRGIVFSSCLSIATTEQPKDLIHEIAKGDIGINDTMANLKEDSFFNNSPWCYNIIRH